MLGVGGCDFIKMVLINLLTVPARSASTGLTADSTLAVISVAGTLAGVTAKFKLFFSRVFGGIVQLVTQLVFGVL